MVGVLPADANVTLVAHMLSRRLAEANATSTTPPDVGVTHSAAESFWSYMFLVVVLVLGLCMCCAVCGIGAQLLGCGSFLTSTLLSGFSAIARLCTSCCNGGGAEAKARASTTTTRRSEELAEARVIGPAPAYEPEEELSPLQPKPEAKAAPSKDYACCGFALPCLAWFSVCGCTFVGCGWLDTCWERTCGGRKRNPDHGRREAPGGGLSFVQNLLTCWRCCGLLPSCCPAQYEPRPRRGAVMRTTDQGIPVVQGTPVNAHMDSRPMPALNLA